MSLSIAQRKALQKARLSHLAVAPPKRHLGGAIALGVYYTLNPLERKRLAPKIEQGVPKPFRYSRFTPYIVGGQTLRNSVKHHAQWAPALLLTLGWFTYGAWDQSTKDGFKRIVDPFSWMDALPWQLQPSAGYPGTAANKRPYRDAALQDPAKTGSFEGLDKRVAAKEAEREGAPAAMAKEH